MIKYLVCLCLLCNGLQLVGAQPKLKTMADVPGFKANLLTSTQKAKSMECDFVQKKFLEVLTEPVVSKGHFCFKRENLIRWEYISKDPKSNYLIVINGDKILLKKADEKGNVIDTKSNKVFKELTEMMMSCFSGNINAIEKKYAIQYFEDEKLYMTRLVPIDKNAAAYLKNIDMYFDKNDMTISRLIMVEPSGDSTEYNFTNKKLNMPISDERFKIN
jgi:outer membrane lipoprotein carrier protein